MSAPFGTVLDVGRSVPAWTLNACGFVLAFGMSAPQWDNTVLIILPVVFFLAAAARPGTAVNLLSLGLVLLSLAFGQTDATVLVFPLALGVHLLYLVYGLTVHLRLDSRISVGALRSVGRVFLRWEIPVQLLALLAWLTASGGSSGVLAVAGSAAAVGMALLWLVPRRS